MGTAGWRCPSRAMGPGATTAPKGVTEPTETKGAEQHYRFAGTYQDPTTTHHIGARHYDPRIGRFTQPDPSGQETNPYLYAAGDPVNMIDPNGLGFVDGVRRIGRASVKTMIVGGIADCATGPQGCVVGGFTGAVGRAVGEAYDMAS